MRFTARWIGLGLVLLAGVAQAQTLDPARVAELMQVEHITRNSVSLIEIEGDSVWTGSRLNLTTDGGQTWFAADADSLVDGRGRAFSVDVEGEIIWAGLGFSKRLIVDRQTRFEFATAGFVFSEDGGQSWTYRVPQLDAPGDSVVQYGVSTLYALPVITEEQSPPWDIDYDPATGTVWTAAWASGLRRSDDQGRTWQRVILPPDTLDQLNPETPYGFPYDPRPRDGSENLNFLGFAVHVDETGTIWAGTAGGLNRSTDGGLSWRRYSSTALTEPLSGNWVIEIEEQPDPGRNPIWFTTWRAEEQDERFGIMVTRDGGETFETALLGERINDLAFRGTTVYAAGDNGLFISDDGGRAWRSVTTFYDADQPDRALLPNVRVLAVGTTETTLWVGTADGLVKSEDNGNTWTIFRAEVPLNPSTPSDLVPQVEAYAYPNPFSPPNDGFVRLRYELDGDDSITIRIFDFGMNLVRTLIEGESRASGIREDRWDGSDDRGLRLANGTYFYAIESSDGTAWGKILLIE